MRIEVVCRNPTDDRVIPRFAAYLGQIPGWNVSRQPQPGAHGYYLSGYFEESFLRPWPSSPVGGYLTHREEVPHNGPKAQLFDKMAKQLDLRVTTAKIYTDLVASNGPTIQIKPPVERDFFTPPARKNRTLTAGFSGYTYGNGRKGEGLAPGLVSQFSNLEWSASGRGWPVQTRKRNWDEMADFYRSLDILVVTALVEGGPMPPLEALSCGTSVVIPRGVGLLDELPDIEGIYRYEKGNQKSLNEAFSWALALRDKVHVEDLREVTADYTVTGWQQKHILAFEELLDNRQLNTSTPAYKRDTERFWAVSGRGSHTGKPKSKRGVVCVAFGDPSRTCAEDLMATLKTHVPEIPICLVAAKPIGNEDVFVEVDDSDIGGRRAKLNVYNYVPDDWESVLYMDADTEVTSPDIRYYFELIESGWEFVICKDPNQRDTMHSFKRANNAPELAQTEKEIGTLNILQFNGGVWAFAKKPEVAEFFSDWVSEWERWGMRDQGALVRAMYKNPLRVYVLGNEWNWFHNYCRNIEPAAIKHWPGKARRWIGQVNGRLDSELAWKAVKRD